MSKPIRVQRKRTKGWRMPANTVYVGRPSIWGNPYNEKFWGRDSAIEQYHSLIQGFPQEMLTDLLKPLKGKNLACWCPLGNPCHADVLLELANA